MPCLFSVSRMSPSISVNCEKMSTRFPAARHLSSSFSSSSSLPDDRGSSPRTGTGGGNLPQPREPGEDFHAAFLEALRRDLGRRILLYPLEVREVELL